MKNLSDFLKNDTVSERLERKFIMSKGQAIHADMTLKSIGFQSVNQERLVSSVYFDDKEYKNLRENIDGNYSRDKLRVRFYNNKIKNSILEIKHKRGTIGYKTLINFKNNSKSIWELISHVQDWCKKECLNMYFPSALISYERKYYKKSDFRVTIDNNINGYRIAGECLITSSMLGYSVTEFKYPKALDNEFRKQQYFNELALRMTKCSKYSNALMY